MQSTEHWRHRIGMKHDKPGPGQESVWDYPRPPRLERSSRHVRVQLGGAVIADSTRAFRVLETSHPPSWYIPAADVRREYIYQSTKGSFCEWKGQASYWSIKAGNAVAEDAGWSYEDPSEPFSPIASCFAFYPHRVDCYVDDERVQPQAGGFYGGWVTKDVVGPFKGSSGTSGW